MDLIETAYAAAADEVSWETFADSLRSRLGAHSVSLWRGDPDGGVELLSAPQAEDRWTQAYADHYHRTDLWTSTGASILRGLPPGAPPPCYLSAEIVPDAVFRASEFHSDFARHLGMFHMIGSMALLGDAGWYALGCHRPESANPFEETDRQTLHPLLPHLRRALQLRARLHVHGQPVSASALDALPTALLAVDAEMRVRLANAAAERMARDGALRLIRDRDATRLAAPHRADTAALAIRVRAVALCGDAGGGVALRRADGGPSLAALVMRLPPLPAAPQMHADRGRLALVLVRDPVSVTLPSAELLSDLYGLSRAEADVALAAASGQTAEQIAAGRRVGVSTVRTQIRMVLEKAGAASLRDLGRMLTMLAG